MRRETFSSAFLSPLKSRGRREPGLWQCGHTVEVLSVGSHGEATAEIDR